VVHPAIWLRRDRAAAMLLCRKTGRERECESEAASVLLGMALEDLRAAGRIVCDDEGLSLTMLVHVASIDCAVTHVTGTCKDLPNRINVIIN
jgi:hypothetical protein